MKKAGKGKAGEGNSEKRKPGRPATKNATTKKVKSRSVHIQASIKQVLARTGKPSTPQCPASKSFSYKSAADVPRMKRKAELWLLSQRV